MVDVIDIPAITRDELAGRLGRVPRVQLAHLPTPLELCSGLSARLGGPQIYIKRDDMTGLALGGNKTRQLEFLFPEILSSGADTVVAGAYTQSNWCRQITAAAAKLGLRVRLLLMHGVKGPVSQGNLLLDRLMGAEVSVVDIDDMQQLTPLLEAEARALSRQGRRPYVVAPFALDMLSLSALGYVGAALELDRQLADQKVVADHVYVAGANMTPAGLLVGLRVLGSAARVVSISPIRWDQDRATDIARIANAVAERLDLVSRFVPADITADESYIGERYGVVTPAAREAIRLLAETDGILLDPVYTAKAMAGLIDHVRRGRIGKDETVVFVHTGGQPAIFAYAEDLLGG
jgi:D-cysteine desulfhydrase family pyridoxal phosphate-dependent enzyme